MALTKYVHVHVYVSGWSVLLAEKTRFPKNHLPASNKDTQIITSLALSTPLHGQVSCEQIYYHRLYNTLKFSTLIIGGVSVVVGVILLHLQM